MSNIIVLLCSIGAIFVFYGLYKYNKGARESGIC